MGTWRAPLGFYLPELLENFSQRRVVTATNSNKFIESSFRATSSLWTKNTSLIWPPMYVSKLRRRHQQTVRQPSNGHDTRTRLSRHC
jgi:hypothetical protein